jgi:broad specificity phosphatase PhoE
VISEQIGVGPVQLETDLMEAAFGPWQGLTVDEIEHGWPGYLAEHRRPDGAELPEHVAERGLAALRRIAATTPGGEVLVVCHAGILRSMRLAIEADDLRFGNLGGCWMSVHHDGRVVAGDMVQLVDPRFNDLL